MKTITEDVVKEGVRLTRCGLSFGLGNTNEGKICIEAVWCKALGLPHSDDPKCVNPYLRSLKIRLNDSNWSSPKARAKGLEKLGVAQLGTKDTLDEVEFRKRVQKMTIQKIVSLAFRAAAELQKQPHKDELKKHAETLSNFPTIENLKLAKSAAYDCAAAAYAAAYAAAAYAAAAAAYASGVKEKKRDEILSLFADEVLKILIDMKAPGCKWLYLCEE